MSAWWTSGTSFEISIIAGEGQLVVDELKVAPESEDSGERLKIDLTRRAAGEDLKVAPESEDSGVSVLFFSIRLISVLFDIFTKIFSKILV